MADNTSVDLARIPGDNQLAASSDLLRAMVQTFAEALMGADADAICGAPYGQRSVQQARGACQAARDPHRNAIQCSIQLLLLHRCWLQAGLLIPPQARSFRLQPLPSTGPGRAIVSACSFSAARFSRKQQERQRRASGAEDSGHGERALESVGERGGKRSAAVEPDPVVGNPADQPDMREAEPWHHALLGEQNGGSVRVLPGLLCHSAWW